MGIFEFFLVKNLAVKKCDDLRKEKENNIVIDEKEFVPALSFVELQRTDWVKFAGTLKREGVLSNSYDKNPVSVEYSLDKTNSPVVELTFQSKTSDSIRKVQLFNDHAYLYVNSAIEAFPETQRNITLNKLWKDYQDRIRYYNKLETNREGYFHSVRGKRLMEDAKKMMKMTDIYDREQDFLEKYQDTQFDGFHSASLWVDKGEYSTFMLMPQFVPLEETDNGEFKGGDPVLPFTPRTLEHCILHMTNDQKCIDGEYLDDFEEKCRKIQEFSCFESEDWDKVIEFGKEMVRKQYIADFCRWTEDECVEKE